MITHHSPPPSEPTSAAPQEKGSPNPLGTALNVVVSVPESIQIRMVNASALSDYETWIFLAAVLSNAVVGFTVTTLQAYASNASNSTQLLWTTIVSAILFTVTFIKALHKRYSVTKAGKNINLKTTEATLN